MSASRTALRSDFGPSRIDEDDSSKLRAEQESTRERLRWLVKRMQEREDEFVQKQKMKYALPIEHR